MKKSIHNNSCIDSTVGQSIEIKDIDSIDICNDNKLKNDFSESKLLLLKNSILTELENSGFIINGKKLEHRPSKDNIRELHRCAVEIIREKYRKRLEKKEMQLIKYIADGEEIIPEDIKPKLVYVDSKTEYWNLFNYIKIHWSIPISKGYGRRLCYVVFDENNNKVIGIFGLADPVFSMATRDNYIGWNTEQKKSNMYKVMDGFVIGSTPPYNFILGGKLVASMLFSNKVRRDFYKKYHGSISLISKKTHSGDLVLITTLSAFGKSAIYDRLRLPNEQKYISTGYSKGWGEFHFNGENYERMKSLVLALDGPSRKKKEWGTGFRNRREVVHKALRLLNIPRGYGKHGVKREQFIIPLAKNYKDVLCKNIEPDYYNFSVSEISEYMRNRWIIPRAKRRPEFKNWRNQEYLLWKKK